MLWTRAKQTQGERQKRIQRGEEKEKRGDERGFIPCTVKNIQDVEGAGQQEGGKGGGGFGISVGIAGVRHSNTRCTHGAQQQSRG